MSFLRSAPILSVRSSIQPAEANCGVQIVSISITSVSPPPCTVVLTLSSSSLYCTCTWLTFMPVAAVKSAMRGCRRLLLSVHSILTTWSPAAAGALVGVLAAGAVVGVSLAALLAAAVSVGMGGTGVFVGAASVPHALSNSVNTSIKAASLLGPLILARE